ncbi:SRPBCC family protein [soil metagenome]
MARAIESRIVSQAIDVTADAVYRFARQGENLPLWASGLASGVFESDGRWIAESPMGRVTIEMTPVNPYRVLDHEVILPDGGTTHNAMRVTPIGDGASLVSFVALRQAGMTDDAFEQDVAHIARDLLALKSLLEDSVGRQMMIPKDQATQVLKK